MTPKLVIFDCDGVLVDSEMPLHEVLVANLARYGLAISLDQSLTHLTGMVMSAVEARARGMGADLPGDWQAEIYAEIFARMGQGVPLSSGVPALFERLETAGIAVAVASNGPMHKMSLTLGPHGLFDRLKGRIFSAHDHGPGKPAPDMLLTAARLAGVAPHEALMIDDSPAGALAARAAAMPFLGYAEHGEAAPLEALGAPVARSMTEVGRVIFGALA